jgi:DNA gyrase inhibitor GyrI
MLAAMRFDTTERDETPVMTLARAGTPEDIPAAAHRAWQDLEALVPPKGRKAYGYWDPPSLEYRACYSLEDSDDPEALGLERAVLPGGLFRRGRIKGDDAYAQIGPAFDALAKDATVDEGRPWLEVYRRHDEVDVLVPIRS